MTPPPITDKQRKLAIAKMALDAVKAEITALNAIHTGPPGLDTDHVTFNPVSNLEMQVRVRTHDSGIHYYNVKVSESW